MAAFAVNLGVENISGLKFWVTLTMLERGWTVASLVVYAAMNLVLVLSSIYITITYAPAAAGSGIADVKVSLRGGWLREWAAQGGPIDPAPMFSRRSAQSREQRG